MSKNTKVKIIFLWRDSEYIKFDQKFDKFLMNAGRFECQYYVENDKLPREFIE